MLRAYDLIKFLERFDPDTPIFLSSHYDGYDELEKMGQEWICYQGIHAESGEWQQIDRAESKDVARGKMLVITLE